MLNKKELRTLLKYLTSITPMLSMSHLYRLPSRCVCVCVCVVCVCVCMGEEEDGKEREKIKGKIKKSKRSTKYSFEPLDSQGEKGMTNVMPTRKYISWPRSTNFGFVSESCLYFNKQTNNIVDVVFFFSFLFLDPSHLYSLTPHRLRWVTHWHYLPDPSRRLCWDPWSWGGCWELITPASSCGSLRPVRVPSGR